MAKGVRSTAAQSSEPQEEMTVFMVRVKGTNATLLKGLETIKEVVASMGHASLPNAKRLSSAKLTSAGVDEEDELAEDEDANEGAVIDAAPAAIVSAAWKPRKYKFMDDFDLTVSEKPWKDFAAAKAPKSDNQCYLVAAQWLTENAETPTFTAAHMFTLFRAMKWNEQKDFTQPMRKLKSVSSYFDNPTPKTWKLTGIGLDAAKAISGQEAE